MGKFRLVDYYDVWGDVDNGWQVNDVCMLFDDLNITDSAEDTDIIRYLHSIGYLADDIPEDYEVSWMDADICEITAAYDERPLCRLEKVRDAV